MNERSNIYCERCDTRVSLEPIKLTEYNGITAGAKCDCDTMTKGEAPEHWVETDD